MKENNSYTGFGSQMVFGPKDVSLPDKDKNVNESATRWHNLKLQFRHFTIRAQTEDTVNNVDINKFKHDVNSKSTHEANNDERLLLIETNSCESFHSCHSFISNQDLVKSSHNHGDMKNSHQYSRQESSKEEFLDQITMVNAIFLNKKTYGNIGNDSFQNNSIRRQDLFNKTNQKAPDSSINNERFLFKTDQCSGDKTVVQDCKNCKLFPYQKCIEIEETINNGKEKVQNHSKSETKKLIHEKYCTINSGLKTFKINRKIIHGINKPTISKLIRKKAFNQTMLLKLPHEIKCSGVDVNRSVETLNFPEANGDLHKCVLLLWKHCVHEGYEMHFLEPIQLTNYSIALCSKNAVENSNIDIISFKREEIPEKKECITVNSYDDFEKSCLKLYNKQQNSYTGVPITKEMEETEISTNFVDDSANDEVNRNSIHNIDLKLHLIKDQDSPFGKHHDLEDITVLYESEAKYSIVSLNKTFFETILENECCTEKSDIGHLKPKKGYGVEGKSDVTESNESGIENITEQNLGIETENSTQNVNRNRTSCGKHRSSSSRKSALPVIEEGLEEVSKADVLDNDYCLVDTFGRPIHLFDRKGLPLTDGSGRPLRSTGGELLMRCDDDGIPVVDEDTQIFDMFGRQPHEEGFQPWMSPQIVGASRLTTGNGHPLVLFDLQGRPLTSISGTMLVDSSGRSLLKLRNCFVPSTVQD